MVCDDTALVPSESAGMMPVMLPFAASCVQGAMTAPGGPHNAWQDAIPDTRITENTMKLATFRHKDGARLGVAPCAIPPVRPDAVRP